MQNIVKNPVRRQHYVTCLVIKPLWKKKYTSALFRILRFFFFFFSSSLRGSLILCSPRASNCEKHNVGKLNTRAQERIGDLWKKLRRKIPIELYSSSPVGEVICFKAQWFILSWDQIKRIYSNFSQSTNSLLISISTPT